MFMFNKSTKNVQVPFFLFKTLARNDLMHRKELIR